MSHHSIHPFYFPTTVFFVDDSIDFLANLSLQLNPLLSFQLYDSPDNALTVLNDENNQSTPIARFFSRFHHTDDVPLTHHILDVNLDKVHREVYNEHRFEQISVAVVDYDMPSINGIEFCKGIRNPAIKKILLTGKADEKIAVQAFNQGTIDRFILKQDKNVIEQLNTAISELQHLYFNQTERMLTEALAIGKHTFLRDPKFADKFQEICNERNIVEYYLCSEPDGLLMLDSHGTSSLLLIPSEDALMSQYEIAYEQGAPQALLTALKSDQYIPYFWKHHGYYSPECQDWQTFLFPATLFQGNQWHSYAIVENPPPFKTHTVFSYRTFLDELDQLKWTGQTS